MLYYLLIPICLIFIFLHCKEYIEDYREFFTDMWKDLRRNYNSLFIRLLLYIPLVLILGPLFFALICLVPVYELLTIRKQKEIRKRREEALLMEQEKEKLARKREKEKLLFEQELQAQQQIYEGYAPSKQNKHITLPQQKEASHPSIKPGTHQVIYIEQDYNTAINDYIQRHYVELMSKFKHGTNTGDSYEFIYLPKHAWVNGEGVGADVLHYSMPSLQEEDVVPVNAYVQTLSSPAVTQLLSALVGEDLPGPALFRMINEADEHYEEAKCSYFHLEEEGDAYLTQAFAFYRDHLGGPSPDVMYQLARPSQLAEYHSEDLANYHFNYEAHKLAAEVQERIARLQLSGFDQLLISSLRKQLSDYAISKPQGDLSTARQSLSRLLITADYRVKLLDFEEREIKLTPLPKAVFFLFLRHPEGIILKHLCDHREELLDIYKALAYRESYESLRQSIDAVIDPTKNSINEKASRIKEAFVGEFSDELARHYYITGGRGQKKRITLSRQMVVWEAQDLPWPFTESVDEAQAKALDKRLTTLHKEAQKAMDAAQYPEAIAYLDEAVAICDYNYRSYMLRAIGYFHTLDYALSEQDDNKAISLYPDPNVVHYNRAEVRLMLKKYDEALADINVYLPIESTSQSDGHFLRGLIYMELGMIAEARKDWLVAKQRGHAEAKKYLRSHRTR